GRRAASNENGRGPGSRRRLDRLADRAALGNGDRALSGHLLQLVREREPDVLVDDAHLAPGDALPLGGLYRLADQALRRGGAPALTPMRRAPASHSGRMSPTSLIR